MALSQTEKHNLLKDLINLLQKENCFQDTCIYIDDKRYFSEKCSWHTNQHFDDELNLWYQDNIDVKDYIEYSNPDTLTVTFEGPLYHALNYDNGNMETKLNHLFKKYGLYFEYGYAWSFTLYDN